MFGPSAGSSILIQLATTVTESVASFATYAYTSVSSAVGSLAVLGASRWLEPKLSETATAAASNAASTGKSFFTTSSFESGLRQPRLGSHLLTLNCGGERSADHKSAANQRFLRASRSCD